MARLLDCCFQMDGLHVIGSPALLTVFKDLATWKRHEKQLDELEERLGMLNALRESRDALEWRVTQTKAALIVLRSGVDDENVDPEGLRVGE